MSEVPHIASALVVMLCCGFRRVKWRLDKDGDEHNNGRLNNGLFLILSVDEKKRKKEVQNMAGSGKTFP